MKKHKWFSRTSSRLGRWLISRNPKAYIFINRINSAVLRETFQNISQSSLIEFWRSFDFITLPETRYKHFGDKADGGYLLAIPFSENSEVVSIGVGENLSFDFSISQHVLNVHMFDHTILPPHDIPSNGIFHNKGLGLKSSENLLSLTDILGFVKKESRVILKIDIESSEWDVLEALSLGEIAVVDQLVIEYHDLFEILKSPDRLAKVNRILSNLSSEFWTINISPNNWGNAQIIQGVAFPDVIEVSYLRKSTLTTIESTRISTRGFPNNPNQPRLLLEFFQNVSR